MSDDATATAAKNDVSSPPAKKSRLSNVSRATAEGEALLKEMGFDDKETPGRRRTRASLRGDVYTPSPKKVKKPSTPGTGRRGRPPKQPKVEKPVEKEEKKEEAEDEEEKAAEDETKEEADGDKDE